MLRLSMFAALVASVTPACTTDVPNDELAGESPDDGEAGKGDAVDAFGFFNVDPDVRACSFDARCGGFFVSRPNRSTTICGRGQIDARCYVDSLDWSGTGLPDSVALEYENRLRAGEELILKGDIVPDAADRGATFAVTQVWLPRSPTGVVEGVAVLAKDNGIRCITAPCPSLTEFRVNSNRFADITDIDFSLSGADDRAIELAGHALFEDGVLVFGYRYYPSKNAKGRTANQFYTRAPVPLF